MEQQGRGGAFLREFPRPVFAAGLRASPHPAAPRTMPFFFIGPGGPYGGGHFAGNPAPCRAANAAKIGLAGFPAPPSLRDTPRPAAPLTLIFSLLALAGVALQLTCRVWLGGHLFANILNYRCSFMTERTKGPAVSMRRPPTRGPRDPWTPRKIALRGHLCEPLPRRPTVDGPAHEVGLHNLYAGGCAAPHRRRGVAQRASPWPLRRRHPRRPTLDGPAHSVHLHALYVCGDAHAAGNPAPRRAAHAAKIG